MWRKYISSTFVLYSLSAFAENNLNSSVFFDSSKKSAANTIARSLSSESQTASIAPAERSSDYPTQVIRITSNDVEKHQLTCAQVNKEIDRVLINNITRDKFSYTTLITCTYDPDTRVAINFSIQSYFDPINDEAITFLTNYLAQYNGSEFLGTILKIESAKALVVSLNLSVGVKKNPNTPPFIEYRSDRSTHYFKSNYDLHNNLIADANKRFFSDEPSKVLPFIDKWFFNHAGTLYRAVLRDSNFALLEPERIFLMDDGEAIFVSPIKHYYWHNCTQYEHQHCLKQEL